jgi:hypothetical protein
LNKIILSSILAIILLSSVFTANFAFGADSTKEIEAKKKDDAKRQEELKKAKEKAKQRAEQAKKMVPKMLQVYVNNLDSNYTLVKTLNDDIHVEHILHDSSHFFITKKGDAVLSMVIQFKTNEDARLYLDSSVANVFYEEVDTYEFKLSKEEKCVIQDAIQETVLMCTSEKHSFVTSSSLSRDDSFKFMDIMLKKYYKAHGKEFKQSTKQLSKKATLIPKIEKTFDEKINSLFMVEVIDCASKSGNYVEWKGSITSYASEKLDVKMILTGKDLNDNIVTFEETYVIDLYPEQTQYISRLLTDMPKFDSCGYKIESFR